METQSIHSLKTSPIPHNSCLQHFHVIFPKLSSSRKHPFNYPLKIQASRVEESPALFTFEPNSTWLTLNLHSASPFLSPSARRPGSRQPKGDGGQGPKGHGPTGRCLCYGKRDKVSHIGAIAESSYLFSIR